MEEGAVAALNERIDQLEGDLEELTQRLTNLGQHVGGLRAGYSGFGTTPAPPPQAEPMVVPCRACKPSEAEESCGLVGHKVCWGCRGAGVHRL